MQLRSHMGHHLRAPASAVGALLYGDQTPGTAHRPEDPLPVPWHQRAQVDHPHRRACRGRLPADAAGQPPSFPGGLTLAQWQPKGHDAGSIVADPHFVDSDHDDFRLKPDSPAIRLGFQPIDPSTIGLVGPDEWVALPGQVQRETMVMPSQP